MNILKRINNLWKLSALDVSETINNPFIQGIVESSKGLHQSKMATIIKKENNIEKFLNGKQ